jgi:hypothetical protein
MFIYFRRMKMRIFILLLLPSITFGQLLPILTETSGFKKTPEYQQIIDWWKAADRSSEKIKMFSMGPSDAGFPLHLVLVQRSGQPDLKTLKSKTVILINNGIHPGEPDGIDASMILVRDLITGKTTLPSNIILAIIPVYNIGGCLNRSANYRVDQEGPEEFGFRGNSQNLDLNRDFIKADSKEARSFAEIFHACDPLVFADNHVSNGADYQHVMTLLTTQHNKLGGAIGEYLNNTFEPGLYQTMKAKGYDLVPYVNHFGETPDSGWSQFVDYNRYSSGYASLWQCFSFTPETHMLKTYEQRVKATIALMRSFIEYTSVHEKEMQAIKKKARQEVKTQATFPITWNLEKDKSTSISFKGFEAGKKTSKVSGLPRLYYDRNKPFEKQVPFQNYFAPDIIITKPSAYIIPQGWWKVIELLKFNKVQMVQLKRDTVIEVEQYHIVEYKTSPRQYEMHHLNSDVKLALKKEKIHYRKNDYYIPLNQEANRFIIEVLEPQAPDSYFAWNFFDAILGQKEGYSHYVFEDKAADYLEKHPDLRNQLESKKQSDSAFAKSASAQLDFVYRNSEYFEPAYMTYPVGRVR